MYRLLLSAFIFIVVACVPVAAPGSSPSEPEEQFLRWDNPYEKIVPDLCPPDLEPVERPIFGEPTPAPFEGADGTQLLVQRGVFPNIQGELFGIFVTGVNIEVIKEYTEQVKVCLDQIFTGEISTREGGEAEAVPLPDALAMGQDDLVIEIHLLGFSNPEEAKIRAEELVQVAFTEWSAWLKERELSPEQTRPDAIEQDYFIDFVIDPTVNNNATHDYNTRNSKRVYARVQVQGGGGAVGAGLCRDSNVFFRSTLVPPTGELSDSQGANHIYDLGIKGAPNGTYRVSGRQGWQGWSVTYDYSGVPTGQTCIP